MLGRWIVRSTAMAVVLVTLMAVSACTGIQETAQEARITSLTIFPVTAMGEQHKNMGEALGLLLEKSGFRRIKIAEVSFRPQAEADFDKIAASFGRFIGENPIATDYALYCEFQGTPQEGVQGVREVLVDKEGKVFWTDVQAPRDPDFERIKPSNPMTCCMLVTERLRPMLVLASPEELEGEGEMARLWARKSGTPDKKELDAIKVRQGKMRETAGQATVVVYPIRVGKKADRESAEHLVSLLNERNLCRARVADEPLSFEVKLNSNEQRVLWDMAKTFQSHMREKAPAADYALYGDHIIVPHTGKVWAVHFVVCDGNGDFVIVDFQNDHHRDFRAISPESLQDCNRLAATRLAGYLQ